MRIYNALVQQLDSTGARYSQDLSEVDLSDPDDVKVLANNSAGEVLVHLGSSNYLDRYKIYVAHVEEWRQQFSKLESVDLRYDRQIVVNPDMQGAARQAPISVSAAKVAMAAGVKPAALISHSLTLPRPHPATPGIKPEKVSAKVPAKAPATAARKWLAKKRHGRTAKKNVSRKTVLKKAKPRVASTTQSTLNIPPSPPSAPTAKTNPPAPPKPASDAAKPGKKPSPAIAKGQDHP
jgi:cell division protein FtsQ